MFICSVRAGTLRFVLGVCLAVCLLGGVLYALDAGGAGVADGAVETVSYGGMKTDEDRLNFLRSLGWETTGEVVSQESFTLPVTFDRVLLGYNEIQKTQGLDLSRYRKKKVTRYTYQVTNYEGYDGTVYANLIVYRHRIIAGDICSADPMGFVVSLEREEGSVP